MGWAVECQWVEFVRHSEHDVKVARVEQFLLPRLEPSFARLRLALRTTAISTGVIRDTLLLAALEAHVDVSAKRGAAAGQDGPECLHLLIAEAGLVAFQELVTLRTEDVGHPGSWVLGTAKSATAVCSTARK